MHLTYRNVNEAFHGLVELFDEGPEKYTQIVRQPSRNGEVLKIDEPVTVTYSHPTERVLFNLERDANPFFHLYESLWMLAGRNDLAPLVYYNSKFGDYSDDGKTLNGAYGYRWRHAKVADVYNTTHDPLQDQLDILVNHIKADPTSRRAVLQMWNVEDDLLKVGSGIDKGSRDVCCNLSVMFSIRDNQRLAATCAGAIECKHGFDVCPTCDRYLDMTVTNRSNDLIWGCLGANYVHFTILQEYMAARIGVEVGKYHHFTNNLHVYISNWKPKEWLNVHRDLSPFTKVFPRIEGLYEFNSSNDYVWGPYKKIPLVKDPVQFEKELPKLVENYWEKWDGQVNLTEPFFKDVAAPMFEAYRVYKKLKAGTEDVIDRIGALERIEEHIDDIKDSAWQFVARNWLAKRLNREEAPVE